MNIARRQRGALLLETVVVGVVMLFAATGLITIARTGYVWQTTVTGQTASNAGSRRSIDAFAEHLRGAQMNTTLTVPVVVASGSATDVTYYTSATGDTARYWMDNSTSPATLKVTTTPVGGPGTTITVATGLTFLSLTYYITTGSHAPGLNGWATTVNSHSPTAAERPLLGAIMIQATYSVGGTSRQLISFVRLRNSP